MQKEGFPTLSLGDKLGEFKDEAEEGYGPGHYLSKFFCGGPKSYGYKVSNGVGEVVKKRNLAKGFTLDCRTLKALNPESMLASIVDIASRKKIRVVNPRKICREKRTATLYNREEVKEWSVVYTKHVLLDENVDYGLPFTHDKYFSLPFGYFDADS